jgi:CheY-like chemotaxis protein
MVLVVDDEASVLAVTSQTLEAFGYQTLTATNGSEAVTLYTQRGPEISAVLSDMVMPVMDGPATIRALKKIDPAVKIIVASGSATSRSVTKDSECEVRHFLNKPYTATTLLKTLRMVLDEDDR